MWIAEGGQVRRAIEGFAQLEAQMGERIRGQGGTHHLLHAGGAAGQIRIVWM